MHALRVLRDQLHVSVSQVRTFNQCPQKYRLQYVIGVAPAFVPTALAFGSSVHQALAFHYSKIQATARHPALDEVVQVFRDAWSEAERGRVPLQLDDEERDWPAKGAAMLTAFYRHVESTQPAVVEGVEVPFVIELHHPDTDEVLEERLVGAFDLVLREGDLRIIVEHKTSARRYSEDQLRNDQQVSAYRLAARLGGLGEVALRFQVLGKTKVPFVQIEDVHRDERDETDFLRTIVSVLRAVDAGVDHPIRGWQCATCPYAHRCPGHR